MSEQYKASLNLPHTDFPMKANLAEREKDILKHWEAIGLYAEWQVRGKNKPKFILADGPPYANGPIHIGHACNKILKDIIVKSKVLSGLNISFVPGWDCHGLPIELNVEKQVGKPGIKIDAAGFREKCREYAEKQVILQRDAFIRLGVVADWQHPYLTMDFHYEANIIRSLAKIIENGHLHKGYKPVHWCIDCGSALAEAEVEYFDKTSAAIDVCFKIVEENKPSKLLTTIDYKTTPICVVIWTTTPWTLPANEAVAIHAEFEYVLLEVELPLEASQKRYLIVAENLVTPLLNRLKVDKYRVLEKCKGEALNGVRVQHPFYPKTVPIVLGEHVTLETGTGAVHTAPAHGQEDYLVGQKYHLPLDNPVGPNGCYIANTPLFAGEPVFKANDKIIAVLKERGTLLHQEPYQHSYPHCWRHKTPLIFRATEQWFMGMDQKNLRQKSVAEIKKVSWVPAWGEKRIEGMILDRPDWCISRQRTWSTPMGIFIHKETGDLHPATPTLMEKVAGIIEKEGIEGWYNLSKEAILGKEAEDYIKGQDTLDVWFDSGVMHHCVLDVRPELHSPADLFLEGSDQHRGWFQSSLLTSVAMKGKAPYKQVLTHGFTVDAEGRKMSKSLGNVVAPEKVVSTLGADILRLWVAATDYRTEMAVSDEILKRISDAYRRIRNTARFLLANLNGFQPEKHQVPYSELIALDRYIVDMAKETQKEIIEAYQTYQFHSIYQKIHNFCTLDLGSFYLDVIKDRQYTGQENGLPRRSAQTALYHIAEGLVRWMAPILTFTAEEIARYLPGEREQSVYFSEWYVFPGNTTINTMDKEFWQKVLTVRNAVNKALEEARRQEKIGSGLEAEIILYCSTEFYTLLTQLEDELRFVLITSKASVLPVSEKPPTAEETTLPGLWIEVHGSPYSKCERCWHRREDVNTHPEYPGICVRCVLNVAGSGETRKYA